MSVILTKVHTMATMQAIALRSFSEPSGYELMTLPRPTITDDHDVIIQVHASSINPVDVKKASGVFKMFLSDAFPYQIGYDVAGVVQETGKDVQNVRVGDEVYARMPDTSRGAWAEYAKCPDYFVASKPQNLSFSDAASLPLAAMTALQALQKYRGSLEGKTVFVPAGLSGTGAYACQLAKNVFHAGKVITTVSTSKVPKVPELLGKGIVDQIIDYTTQDPLKEIPRASVDFFFDTTGQSMQMLPLLVPATGTVISVSTSPSSATIQASSVMRRPDNPTVPFFVRPVLDTLDALRRFNAHYRYGGVHYEYIFLDPNGADLARLAGWVEDGKVVPVVGRRVDLRDLAKVREACQQTFQGKGGLGKTVIEVLHD